LAFFLIPFGAVKTYKGSSISLTQDPHEGGKSFARVSRSEPVIQHHRKTDRMDSDAPGAVSCDFINSIYLVDNRLNGLTAEFISENIQAYFFISAIKRANRRGDSFNRAAVAE
jgi:hypothetical protein